jgi:capsular exopolysaccharide synthesis family protein
MSKHFELMNEPLREVARPATPAASPILLPSMAAEALSSTPAFDRRAQEECLKVVQRIFLSQPATTPRTVVFAGVDEGAGCSRICVETARILAANTSAPICVVDANFRTPSLPEFFGVTNHRGLSNFLFEEGGLRTFIKQVQPVNLCLLSAGAVTNGSPALLNSDRFKARAQELREEFTYILIDAPPLNLYTDAVALARVADGVVLVLQADSTRRETAVKAVETLRDAQVQVLGAVLNRRSFPIPEFIYRRL